MEPGKRRMSSFSDERSKRPKLDTQASPTNTEIPSPSTASNRLPDRKRNGQLEERKRGQRLFGALLGTLSQSSSSTAQKRRTEIERKQQAKLRLQAEEHDEQKKQRMESLMAVRRKEQKKYDKQSMHIRHSNMLAQAHFLQTKSEPRLYYKPWELLPSEDTRIKSQIEAAEAIIQQETEKLEAGLAEQTRETQADQKAPTPEAKNDREPEYEDAKGTVGSETNVPPEAGGRANGGSTDNKLEPSPKEHEQVSRQQQENAKDHDDDGGEVVEADGEDMVIY
ncbi:MAG: hypothetical protein LQ338_000330 [Usnochroma carphineum]|nr:MAG: hypothetical protein LQ338_000330 [Usnochroma carphineum]